ncbi:MAG TPA: CoA-binding protein [Conexivisphaerales archaeon]|nr:CoA-binding protein [Conexivisphaerales archaeon]
MPKDGLDDARILEILAKKDIAVVGASRDLAKPAGFVPDFLLRNGYNVIPVNPFADTVLGRRCYKSLAEVPGEMDVVDVFRPSAEAVRVVGEAAARGVGIVWLQEGIYSPEAADLAKAKGMTLAWNRCMKKELQRLKGADF